MADHTSASRHELRERLRRRRRRCVPGRTWGLGRMIDVLTSWTSWTTSHNASRGSRQTLLVDVDYGRKATSHKRQSSSVVKTAPWATKTSCVIHEGPGDVKGWGESF